MLRRLFLGLALIAAFASLSSFTRQPAVVEASPAQQAATITFADHEDGSGVKPEFRRGEGAVWAFVEYPGGSAGSKLSYIMRLNGWDYKWGDLKCGANCDSFAFRLTSKDGDSDGIPGGAYLVLIYDGDTEIARGGFGIKGGRGSDNDNDH